jgi:hypothetical protein
MKKVLLFCLLVPLLYAGYYYGKYFLPSKQAAFGVTVLEPDKGFKVVPVQNQKRVALVIGNADYIDDEHWQDIPSDKKDAEDIAKALEGFGFSVILKTDLTLKEMHKALLEFSSQLDTNTDGLIYYSGHGTQVEGRQYLIPIDADAKDIPMEAKKADESLLSTVLLNVNSDLLGRIESKARVTMLILDACRTSLFSTEMDNERIRKGGKALKKGFDKFEATGTLIASSTASGNASAGAKEGENSIYTAELLKIMQEKPETEVVDLLRHVGTEVKKATKNSEFPQEPWITMSFDGDFHFQPPKTDNEEEQRRIETEKRALETQKADELAKIAAEKQNLAVQAKLIEQQKQAIQVALDKANQEKPLAEHDTELLAEGMYLRGNNYAKGEGGVEQDFKLACEWFKKAADAGNADGKKYAASKRCKSLI